MRLRTALRLSVLSQWMATPLILMSPLAAMPPLTARLALDSGALARAEPSGWLLATVYGPDPVWGEPCRWSADRKLLVSVAAPSCIGEFEVRLTPFVPRFRLTAPPVAVEILF